MIIVTGATGHLGSQTVHALLGRVPADQVGVSVRDIDKAADLVARGVRARRGDFTDPDSLVDAFEGATQVLIVSAGAAGGAPVDAHAAAIDAARAAGARRVLYTSQMAAAPDSHFPPMPVHFATEQYLAETGTAFTALRNGFYAEFIPRLLGQALETGELVAPADGPIAWTTHADLADATAAVLAAEGQFDGPTPPLTAPDALDLGDVADILTELTARPIRRVVADDDEFRAGLIGRGAPEGQADMLLGMFLAARNGEFAAAGPTLEDLLGRAATPVRSVLEEVVRDSASKPTG